MKNLAGNQECDFVINRELKRCGIPIIPMGDGHNEVPYRIGGQMGEFKFTRAWYYWVVEGKMPLPKAIELFNTEVGNTDIRADGHCGCLDPAKYGTRFYDGKIVISQDEWARCSLRPFLIALLQEKYTTHPAPETLPAFITSYHIDTELGLYLFARAVESLISP